MLKSLKPHGSQYGTHLIIYHLKACVTPFNWVQAFVRVLIIFGVVRCCEGLSGECGIF